MCDENQCSECDVMFLLENGECSCGEGWFIQEGECVKCSSSCAKCGDYPTQCAECKPSEPVLSADLTCNSCSIYEGFGKQSVYTIPFASLSDSEKSSLLQNCQEICGDGIVMGTAACDDGNLENGDGCSSTCEIEQGWDCIEGNCNDNSPPVPILQYIGTISEGYELSLGFNEPVVIEENLENILTVTMDEVIEWELDSKEYKGIFMSFELKVKPQTSISSGAEITVVFEDPGKVQDFSGKKMKIEKVKAEVEDSFDLGAVENVGAAVQGTVSAAMGASAVAAIGLSSLGVGVDPFSIWAALEFLQIINYLTYMSLDIPTNLRGFFRSLGFANFNFIPNFFVVFGMSEDESEFQHLPERFHLEQVNPHFLLNAGSVVSVWVLVLLFYPFFIGLNKLFPNIPIFKRIRDMFVYSVFLRTSIESFLELLLSIMLQFYDMKPYDGLSWLAVILCFVSLLYILACIGLTIYQVTLKDAGLLNTARWIQRFGTLYEHFSLQSKLSQSFLLFQQMRRTLFVLVLVTLSEYPIVQACFLVGTFALYTGTLILIKPYKNRIFGNWVNIAVEGLLVLAMLMILTFAGDDLDKGDAEVLGWVIQGVIGLSIVGLLGAMLTMQIFGLYKAVKQCLKRYKNVQVPVLLERPLKKQVLRAQSLNLETQMHDYQIQTLSPPNDSKVIDITNEEEMPPNIVPNDDSLFYQRYYKSRF